MSKKLYVFGLIILILAISATAFGQTNELKGKVLDQNGGAVVGADVIARNKANGVKINTLTDDEGMFNFNSLAVGSYLIEVNANGFSNSVREVSLSENSNETIEITLSVGNISEKVTVTATRTQLSTIDTAVPVTVVGEKEIERKNVNTVGDIFRTIPGVTTTNEGAFQVRPRIRGLESNRILILVDGERLNNARTSTGNSGIEPGLVDISQIETLEVVRGSGSVLYGTDALAGTVNIITKNAPRNLNDGFRFGATFNGFYSSNENGRRGNIAVTGSSKFFSFRVAQSLERYENYFTGDADGLTFNATDGFPSDREVGNSQSHGSNTQVTTRFFFDDNNDLRLNYERRRNGNIGSPLLTLDFGFNGFFPFSNRDKFNARFETRNINDYLAKVAGTFYIQNQERNFSNRLFVGPIPPFFPGLDRFSETITDTDSIGFDVQTNWILGNKNFLTAGVSFFRDENADSRFRENRIPFVTQQFDPSVPNADFGSFAAFAQDQFTVSDRVRLVGGIRVERFFSSSTQTNNFEIPEGIRTFQLEDIGVAGLDTGLEVSETAVTGDFGAVFKVTDEVSLSGRLGRSFRVANLFERFFTGPGSVGGFLVGNPNLEPESGINFDTSVKVRTNNFAGSFTYFNNYYRNFLSSQNAFDNRGCPVLLFTTLMGIDPDVCQISDLPMEQQNGVQQVTQTVNIGRARIQGFEAELELPFQIGDGFLTPNGNISYLRGDNLETDQPLNTITPLKTVLNLRWNDVKRNYYADWTTRIVNKQDRLSNSFLASNQGPEPGFVVSDIGGGYTFSREQYRFRFNLGIKNIFNRFYNEQFVFAPARGRSFVVGTTIEFNTK